MNDTMYYSQMSYNRLDVNILQANNNKIGEHVQKVSRMECW